MRPILASVVLLLLLQACSLSMRADLQGSVSQCRRSSLRALQELGATVSRDSDAVVEARLKDGRPVRIVLTPEGEDGTQIDVTVGQGKAAEEISEAVRIIEKVADGVDR